MKIKSKLNKVLMLSLFFFSTMLYSQNNVDIEINYRMKPDRNVAKERLNFYFDVEKSKLVVKDLDFNSVKEYLIKYDKTFYDNAGLFNIVFSTDVVNHTLKKRPKSEIGLFSIIYDEKNGNIVGVKTIFQSSDEIYLTQFGATLLNKI